MESTALSILLQKILLVPIVGLWAFHMYKRKYKNAGIRKRIATLGLTALLIVAWIAAFVFERYGVADRWLAAVAAVLVALAAWQHKLIFPYRLRCVRCGKALGLTRALSIDANLCGACEPAAQEGETRP